MMTMCGRNRYTGTLVRFQRYVVKWQLRYNLHMKFTFDMPDEWVTAIDRLRKKYVSRADLGREAVKEWQLRYNLHMKFTFDMPDEWVTAIDRLRKKYVSRADLGREAVKDYLIKHGQSIECGPVVVKQRKNGAVKKLPEPQPS